MARLDSWRSAVSGIGTHERDKRMTHHFRAHTLTYQEVRALWRCDDIAARSIELVPAECMRPGFKIRIGNEGKYGKLKDQVEQKLIDLGLDYALERIYQFERAYGGGAILMGIDDSRSVEEPVNEDNVHDVTFLTPLEPLQIYPVSFYDDPDEPLYGHPKYYQLNTVVIGGPDPVNEAEQQQAIKPIVVTRYVHHSRLIVFGGILVSQYERAANVIAPYWGDPQLIRLVEVLRDYNIAWSSAGIIATDYGQPVLTMENLMALVAKQPDKVAARMAAFELFRSSARIAVVDAKEKLERQTTPLTGLSELLSQFNARVSIASDIPLPLLMGMTGSDLGKGGESDLTLWENRIRSLENRKLTPAVRRVTGLVMKSLRKRKIPDVYGVEWGQLRHLTDLERAEARLTQMRADNLAIKSGVVWPNEIRKSRFGGEYSFETQIDESKEAPGFMAPLPAGVIPKAMSPEQVELAKQAGIPLPTDGSSPAAPASANVHAVGGYNRRAPTTAGKNPNSGGEVGGAGSRDNRSDANAVTDIRVKSAAARAAGKYKYAEALDELETSTVRAHEAAHATGDCEPDCYICAETSDA